MNLTPILDYGYLEREARFLALVAMHSGHFVSAQYCRFAGLARGAQLNNFIAKALGRGHLREYEYGPGRRRYHLFARPFYKRLGIPCSNRRRDISITGINTRIWGLDFVIDNPQLEFFADDRSKLDFFRGLGMPKEILPAREFVSLKHSSSTPNYFPDRFPRIGVSVS